MPETEVEMTRRLCPESSARNLASCGGQTLLDLLKLFIPSEADVASADLAPVFVPHPAIDRIFTLSQAELDTPGYRTLVQLHRVNRSLLLGKIVRGTLLVFVGNPADIVPPRLSHISETSRGIRAALPPNAPASMWAAAENCVRESAPLYGTHRNLACTTCFVLAKDLGPGRKLSACSRCRPLDRPVYYCSRECQIKDWNEGKPQPHKLICGRKLCEDDLPAM
ncbi:hypothetical protein PsYK624_140610 [Phanerochaete sordida]|uniref:MYND-type domain-containing protein n=1 Tax=Phanerochaete sordida TaxID=48140 RepID=A0A9P3LKM8_9APHY|nr:hypothetical protein PsYK624_140610 [Phanerochaete sordida]